MSTPRLASAFHTFGSQQSDSLRNTASSIVKRVKRSKIHVQPEAVKRRKVKNGSKNKICKGQKVRKNPFRMEAGQRMRLHHFAENVRRNETVAKKLVDPWQRKHDVMKQEKKLGYRNKRCRCFYSSMTVLEMFVHIRHIRKLFFTNFAVKGYS